jgi:hypothetical protein
VYALGYPGEFGQETIELRQNALGQWEIVNAKTNTQILTPEPDIASAFGAFEHYLSTKFPAIAHMKNRSATWRTQKPTEAQLAFLTQLGGHAKKEATKGEVSALIDVFLRRQKRLASFRRRT